MKRVAKSPGRSKRSQPFPIVGVGASAGGLEAFTQLLNHLPADMGMGLVVVQHLDPTHESELTRLLARGTSMPTHEVTDKMRVEPNHVYVIPPNVNMSIVKGMLKLEPRPKGRRPQHAIDFFFESLAEDQRERAIGVILSGTGNDGTMGLEAIKAEGGITFAQDESARYDSMPRSAVAAGCVDFVLSPENIAKELAQIAQHPYVVGTPGEVPAADAAEEPPRDAGERERETSTAHQDDDAPLPSGGHGTPVVGSRRARAEAKQGDPVRGDEGFKKILLLLRNHCGVDFSLYKSPTIQRRVGRRMVLSKHNSLADYAQFLRGNTHELDTLFSDVLISVTSFFRNPEAFDVLKGVVFPKIFKQRRDEAVRVWVLGCSTGQEAYSIGMAFSEFVEKIPRAPKLQIFATDLNDALLEKARAGLYTKTLAADISPERLRRFFVEEEGGYRVVKSLREGVVFARQNLISDPPFSRLDLICCRNLLIYLEPALQKKALPAFHYALKPEGFLFLGASESLGQFTDLFEPVDKKHKIFSKKAVATPALHIPPMLPPAEARKRRAVTLPSALPEGLRTELSAQREADRLMVSEFAPPGVIINAQLQIIQFRGPTSAYLTPPRGKASFDVLKMAREGLMLPLRAAINKAKKENKPVRKDNVRVLEDGVAQLISIQVIPLEKVKERCHLILFEKLPHAGVDAIETSGVRQRGRGATAPTGTRAGSSASDGKGRVEVERADAKALRLHLAETVRELAETRDYLQIVQEEQDAANEELQASNEESQSANEELQSINEELETSKEELESTNEELTTVNEEMARRNAELNRLNADLNNLHVSIHTAILVLGRDLTIRRFTPLAERAFNLLPTDVGRPLSGIRHNLVTPPGTAPNGPADSLLLPLDLENLIRDVIDTVSVREREVQDRKGTWYLLRVRPYLMLDNKIDGAVLSLVDITDIKRTEEALRDSDERFRNLADNIPQLAWIADANTDGQVNWFNQRWFAYTGATLEEMKGRGWQAVHHPDYVDRVAQKFTQHVQQGLDWEDTFPLRRKDGEYRWFLSRMKVIRNDAGKVVRIFGTNTDITDQRQMADELQRNSADMAEINRHQNEFLALLAHELRNPLAPIGNALHILRRTGEGGEAGKPAIDMMQRQVGQMVRLVDDLLDVSRISQGKIVLRLERIELASVLYKAIEAAQPHSERLEQEMTVVLSPQPIYLNADATRLTQVVGNLLNNASKFTERGGRIRLTVERDRGQAVIRVHDSGIGIAADHLSRIFEMFMQVDTSLERTQAGLGIGLTLVKKLVELHGGTIEAHSDGLAKGAEFVVRLPALAEAPPEQQAPPGLRLAAGVRRRVLIVDDNVDSANSMAMLLELSGHEVHTVHDGIEAVGAAAKLQPHLILLDIGLPGINGYEAARRIRQQQEHKELVLVALTGWGQDEDKRLSKEAGFDFHLVKPADLAAIEQLLDSLPAP